MRLALLSQRVAVDAASGERRDALDQRWCGLLQACGFAALAVPAYTHDARALCEWLPVELIVLTGGNDLAAYGGDAPERDALERALLDAGLRLGIPVLGVCRGMQLLQHAYGGTLEAVPGHVRTQHPLDDGRTVNSFHAWGIRAVARGLQALAHAPDGSVEALRATQAPVLGMMWHPERETPFDPRDIAAIRHLTEAACAH